MRNQKIRDELGLIYIERRLKIKPLKWFGHMVWMVNNVSTTSGRIRNTYMVCIEDTARKNGTKVTELRKIAGKRRD